ncbi:MAG: ribonuclease J [Alphaproteobacteria bacterium]|nr:ribonuclease J [Alphaproteobacteria bacterium]
MNPASDTELVFLPLGGSGEIGMNLNLYGYGPPDARKWLMVDLGITFGDELIPGVDVVMPDIRFIAERRRDLLGIVLTHGHEDHIGAVAHLWPQLRCPLYATPFTAALVQAKLDEAGVNAKLTIVELGGKLSLGPFEIELITLTHSIPEPNAVAIRTPLGTVLNTGDWKIDPEPLVGLTTDEAALRRLGDEGVLAMTCDSTNVFVPGRAGSEADVRRTLTQLIADHPGKRVAVTAFASNVARLESVALAAQDAGRSTALVGRSMRRIVGAAQSAGYLKGLPPFVQEEEAALLPRDSVVYLCTGSQGEPGSALARMALGEHRGAPLEAGDAVIFSSRVIPGNEKKVGAMQNALAARGIEIVTDQDHHHVHVSGHPCRDELADMYRWVRPRIAIPVHGEIRHMMEHKRFAESLQVPDTLVAPNGSIVRLAPGQPAIVDEAPSGRLQLDGRVPILEGDGVARARRGLSFAGFAGVTVIVGGGTKKKAAAQAVLIGEGIPESVLAAMREAAENAASRAPSTVMADDEEFAESVRRAVRREANTTWGKRPMVKVEIVRL